MQTSITQGLFVTTLGHDGAEARSKGRPPAGHNALDITGERFASLVALYLKPKERPGELRMWVCLCDCGNTVDVRAACLRRGHRTSCGCKSGRPKANAGEDATHDGHVSLNAIAALFSVTPQAASGVQARALARLKRSPTMRELAE